uniref:Uncharacterized protein n=1 Tax=Rhizophora mucronata TaxID=61149 RepID=A0A2P2PSZ8_RHIMU
MAMVTSVISECHMNMSQLVTFVGMENICVAKPSGVNIILFGLWLQSRIRA